MLWSLEDICRELRYSPTRAKQIVAQPDFPKPVRILDRSHPRWVRVEVEEWVMARKEAA